MPIAPVIPAPAGYGSGIPAERPFRSLSYPDIDYTVMRPATLPPSPFTNPPSTDPTSYTADPGVRNPNLYPGYPTQSAPTGSAAASGSTPVYPGAIPVRRLFQVPDANVESNAGEPGDSFINNQEPTPPATTGGEFPSDARAGRAASGHGDDQWNAGDLRVQQWISEPGLVHLAGQQLPRFLRSPGRRASGWVSRATPDSTLLDAREHPSWRIEMLQRVMNLTTVRTHQYAVWITVGFFEVKRQGDVAMIASGDPRLAFDILGPEIGLPDQKNRRYRGFFLVDRLKLDGFASSSPRRSLSAVVYRQPIQ